MLKKLVLCSACMLLVGGIALWSCSAPQGDRQPTFQPVPNGLQLPKGFQFGLLTAVATDKDDNMYVFHRGKQPIAVFDKTGKFLRSWGDSNVKTAHGLRIDSDGNIWTTDLGTHQVIKYDPAGKVLLTLGTKNKKGESPKRFNRPADVAVSAAGDIYVADGYDNSRVVKFSKDGKYLKAWGKEGTGPGQFDLVHAIFLDGKGRVYVGDRENKRIQVFDTEGKFLAQWRDCGAPYGLYLQNGQRLWVADGSGNLIRLYDLNGKVLAQFGMKGTKPGQFLVPHSLCVDSRGVMYVGEGEGNRLQKFVLR